MQISLIDYWLARFNYRFAKWMHRAGDAESVWLADRIDRIEVRRPVFISGLARAGSTVLLELMSKHPLLATHRYSSFPFVSSPWAWHLLQSKLTPGVNQRSVPRAHQDGIDISLFSPESMEEPIWQGWFPWIHRNENLHTIPVESYNANFERFYKQHIAKLMLLSDRSRYLAKNNYLHTRLNYLFEIFPDARLIVPVRHPIQHTASLVRQHALFCRYATRNSRVAGYLEAAGHYEFGPQRIAIRLDMESADQTAAHWAAGQDQLGYAIQWATVYGEVLKFIKLHPELGNRIIIVAYEDFCSRPRAILSQLLALSELDEFSVDLSHIQPGKLQDYQRDYQCDRQLGDQINHYTRLIAEQLGYA